MGFEHFLTYLYFLYKHILKKKKKEKTVYRRKLMLVNYDPRGFLKSLELNWKCFGKKKYWKFYKLNTFFFSNKQEKKQPEKIFFFLKLKEDSQDFMLEEQNKNAVFGND